MSIIDTFDLHGEEIIALGVEKILYFGSCGALDKEIAEGHLLVPTAAYRDEGVSYHYAKAADYLKIETTEKLMQILDDIQILKIAGKLRNVFAEWIDNERGISQNLTEERYNEYTTSTGKYY